MMKDPFILIVVCFSLIERRVSGDLVISDILRNLVVLMMGEMHEAGAELDADSIKLSRSYAASNPIPRFENEMRDIPLCEYFGSSDTRYASTNNGHLVAI